jgi:hypothetical protein
MRRPNVDALFRFGIDPIRLVSADWEYECMDFTALHDADLKIDVRRCNR